MTSCHEVLAELSNYVDEEVAAEMRAEIEAHLVHCRTCRVLIDSTRKTLRLVTETRPFELPPSLSDRIMEKIGFGRRRD